MSWSAAEIEALAAKAARGAGAPAAQAARFGQVAAVHLMAGRGDDALMQALQDLPAGPVLEYPRAIDSALSTLDQSGTQALEVNEISVLLRGYVEVLPFAADCWREDTERLFLQVTVDTPRRRPPPARITGCDALVARMEQLAALTFVPESEASRRSGAGAATSDND